MLTTSAAPASIRNRLLVMYCAYLGEGWRKNNLPKNSVGPVSEDVASLASFLRLCIVLEWQDRSVQFCRGGPAVPRAAACGAQQHSCGARTEHRHWGSATS